MKDIFRRLQTLDNWTVFYLLVAIAFISSLLSGITYEGESGLTWWSQWFGNLSSELIGAIFTFGLLYFVVGLGNEKKALITQLRSSDHSTAITALEQMRSKGWVEDGTLSGVSLFEAQLSEARLHGANLSNASLWRANLHKAQLANASLRDGFLHYADLAQADLTHANLTGTQLDYANLVDATLEGAQFSEATTLPDGSMWTPEVDMTRFTDRSHAQFWYGYNLSGQELSGGNFADANLAGADLSQSDLSAARLRNANLTRAHLPYANLAQSDLTGARLAGANLTNTNLSDADFEGANLERANLAGANLFRANLTKATLRGAQFDSNTILPDGSKWSTKGDDRTQALAMMRFTSPDHPNFWRSDDPSSPSSRR